MKFWLKTFFQNLSKKYSLGISNSESLNFSKVPHRVWKEFKELGLEFEEKEREDANRRSVR